jgi:predicted heme/steroid binding protein
MKYKRLIIIGSVIFSLLLVGGALALSAKKSKHEDPVVPRHTVSREELFKSDGKNGHVCLVAVDGTVYQIRDFSLWQNGEHTPSKGLAYCGADLSKVIDQAPHGRKILDILIKIGPLQQ